MNATKKTKTYNGWPNRATWNVALWVGNDEPLYRSMLAKREELPRQRFTPADAQDFAYAVFQTGRTPDDDRLADVTRDGWRHIARAWNEG